MFAEILEMFLSSDKRLATDVKVLPGVSMDSDHRLLVMSMSISGEKALIREKRCIIDTAGLQDPDRKAQYVEKVEMKI